MSHKRAKFHRRVYKELVNQPKDNQYIPLDVKHKTLEIPVGKEEPLKIPYQTSTLWRHSNSLRHFQKFFRLHRSRYKLLKALRGYHPITPSVSEAPGGYTQASEASVQPEQAL